MIKDVFVFSRRSWHTRMLKFVWGIDHKDFNNMCPYFWTVVATTLFFILIVPIKYALIAFFGFMLYTWDENKEYCKRREERWREGFKIELENGNEAAIMKLRNMKKKSRYTKFDTVYTLMTTEERSKYIDDRNRIIKEMRDREWDRGEKKRKKQKRIAEKKKIKAEKLAAYLEANPPKPKKSRQQIIGEWTVRIKIFFKGLLVLLALGILWLLYKFTEYCIYDVNWNAVWSVTLSILKWSGIVVGSIAVIVGLVLGIKYLVCTYGHYCTICDERRQKISNFFGLFGYIQYPFIWTYLGFIFLCNVVAYPFIKVWNGICWIGRGFAIIWQVLWALKKDNCPAIEWKD